MLLPDHCSAKVDGVGCQLPPSHIVSIKTDEGEFMVAVVCDSHKAGLEAQLLLMQKQGKVPSGRVQFQPVKAVSTDCVTGIYEDYVEVELNRNIDSDRNVT